MGFTLYEIDEAIRNFDYEIDEETGEILNADALDELNMEREKKIENIGIYIKSLEAESKALKNEIDNLTLRMKRNNNKKESLLNYMKHALNGQKFSTPKVNCTWRRSESVRIIDDYLVPDKFCNIHIERKPDKTLIKKALKEGREISGAILEENNNLTIK